MLLASARLGQIKKTIRLRLRRMTLVVLNEIQEIVVSLKNQTQREDVSTVTNVEAVNTGLLAVAKEKIPLPALVKLKSLVIS